MRQGIWTVGLGLMLGISVMLGGIQPAQVSHAADAAAPRATEPGPGPTRGPGDEPDIQPEAGKGGGSGGGGRPATRTPVPTATPAPITPTRTPTVTPPPATSTSTATAAPPTPTLTRTPTVVPPSPTITSTPTPAIWRPALNTSWQIQFTGTLDTTVAVQMFDLDMFDTSAATVAALKAAGKRVVCYISAGTWEDWRPDAGLFPESVKGNSNGWPGERYLDIRRLDVLGPIMQSRLDLCRAKGFDAVDFDNVDTYSHATSGFALSYSDQLVYNRYLADSAHARGLSAGLKNDLAQIADLLPWFDWAINEQCYAFNECSLLTPFINAGKAVFVIEYDTPTSAFCPAANAGNFNAMRKNLSLDAWREPCR